MYIHFCFQCFWVGGSSYDVPYILVNFEAHSVYMDRNLLHSACHTFQRPVNSDLSSFGLSVGIRQSNCTTAPMGGPDTASTSECARNS